MQSAELLDFSPVFEDKNLLIINKPTGLPSARISRNENPTAVSLVLSKYPSLEAIGMQSFEGGLVHRLDTGTSGLLVFAKTQKEFLRLRELWKNRQVEKTYRAWVFAPVAKKPSLISIQFDLAHHPKSKKKMIAIKNSDPRRISFRGKPLSALTHIRSIEANSSEFSIYDLKIQIETGVMHQIRCHLSAMNWPVLGDRIYQGPPSDRLWLHAWKLKFPLENGTVLSIESQLPENWMIPFKFENFS